jgi:formamidopyrimidine-DNA glycosylase
MFVDEFDGDRPRALKALGPDAMDRISAKDFQALFANRGVAVKAALLDQHTIAGIGNLYADEALFAAKVHPKRIASSITPDEAGDIRRHVQRIMKAAIAARGSSFKDEGYVDAYGRPGSFAAKHKVYGQPGKACPNCGTPIEKTVVAQRGTHFCPSCQIVPRTSATVRESRSTDR